MGTGRKVECSECGKELAVGSLAGHLAKQHDVYQSFTLEAAEDDTPPPPPSGRWDATFYPAESLYRCPVPGCPQGRDGRGTRDSWDMRRHFAYRHRGHRVAVAGECFRRCHPCGMQVSTAGTPAHEASATCMRMTAARRQHTVAAEGRAALDRTFSAYGEVLKSVRQFKYLGRIVSYDDNDTPAIRRNIKKARRQRGQFRRLLERDSVPARVAGMYYQAVIASVLLYGSESWVVSPSTLRELKGFHVEAARRLAGMRPRKVKGVWVYPHTADVLAAAHLQPLAYYIQRRRHTVHNTIRDRDVLKECEGAERRRGTPPRLFWAQQDMTVSEPREYGPEGEVTTLTPSVSRARVAPQARPC